MELYDPLKAQEALEEAPRVAASDIAVPSRARLKTSTSLTQPEDLDARIRADFRVFLILMWRYLNLPDPTPLQLDIAWYLQHSPDRSIIMAFRGAAKSWITAAYVLWLLYCDPQKKVLVVSGSLKRSVAFTNFCLSVIKGWDLLHHLAPRADQRQSGQAFDVGPARPDQSPSFHAAGIGGQIVGFRADVIVGDDVETNTNSLSLTMREKIRELVKEFESILKPGGAIKYLGTPHDEDSLYPYLKKETQGLYQIRVWPAQYPTRDQIKVYGDNLAPYIKAALKKDDRLAGRSTEPTRFTDEDLEGRRNAMGKTEFALQFMLDTSLSNKDRYPLRVSDLVVMNLDDRRGPEAVVWGAGTVHKDLQPMGLDGDHYYHPAHVSDAYAPYSRVVGFVDGSGRGADETSLAIVAELHGTLFLLYSGAWLDGYGPGTLKAIAQACVRFGVHDLYVEDNFGNGMLTELLKPVIIKEWETHNKGLHPKVPKGGTNVEPVKVGAVSKEARILSVMEPITQQHRLVVSKAVVELDFLSIRQIENEARRSHYSLFYQLTHLTREKDSLHHDDRLDAVAGAVAIFAPDMGVNPAGLAQRAQEEREEEELERLFGETPRSQRARAARIH